MKKLNEISKEEFREQLARDTEKFLKAGKQIKQLTTKRRAA